MKEKVLKHASNQQKDTGFKSDGEKNKGLIIEKFELKNVTIFH